jgi:hypothetical protein
MVLLTLPSLPNGPGYRHVLTTEPRFREQGMYHLKGAVVIKIA